MVLFFQMGGLLCTLPQPECRRYHAQCSTCVLPDDSFYLSELPNFRVEETRYNSPETRPFFPFFPPSVCSQSRHHSPLRISEYIFNRFLSSQQLEHSNVHKQCEKIAQSPSFAACDSKEQVELQLPQMTGEV